MEFIDGVKVDASDHRSLRDDRHEIEQVTDEKALAERKINRTKLAKKVVEAFGMMLLYHGFVHCDPHAGNLLVTGSGDKFKVVSLQPEDS